MEMRGVEWGHVFNASGARGFQREGYWFHRLARLAGLRYDGATFVTKTTTLMPRKGNMELDDAHRPAHLVPDCIVVKPLQGVVLNAVGLSGPGGKVLIDRWREANLREKKTHGRGLGQMVVSFMAVERTMQDRISEAASFLSMFEPFVKYNGTSFTALQLNFSCPNTSVDHGAELATEVKAVLDKAAVLDIPIMIKLNALVAPDEACALASHEACDAVVCSNTIPWGKLPDRIDWHGLFGTVHSPLTKYGGGGLSGKPLLPIVEEWIRTAVKYGMRKPIVGGGGILSKRAAYRLIDAGASAVELGSVSILRPWRVAGIIAAVNEVLEAQQEEQTTRMG